MLTDEPYYHELMDYVTRNLIRRMRLSREYRAEKDRSSPARGGHPDKRFAADPSGERIEGPFSFADDAIALISVQQYREYVYPYHTRILDTFSDGSDTTMHLCGDATRHFVFLRDAGEGTLVGSAHLRVGSHGGR